MTIQAESDVVTSAPVLNFTITLNIDSCKVDTLSVEDNTFSSSYDILLIENTFDIDFKDYISDPECEREVRYTLTVVNSDSGGNPYPF